MLFIEVVELVQPESPDAYDGEGHAWLRIKNEAQSEIEVRVDFDSSTGRFQAPFVRENRINADSSQDTLARYEQNRWST